ncbi:MAG: restriction endonuclease subunit S [Campylobacterota bacterium]|nr:restriction endonuclease subunit S [Campylobacterota bacterium]
MNEWREVKVGDIANLYQGLAINKKTDYLLVEKSSLPLLRIKDLQENTQEFFINDIDAPTKCIAKEDDLIFTRTGIVGMVFMGKKGVVHNNCFRIVPKNDEMYLPFYYHYFNRENMRDYLTNISAGSVQPDMNHSIFKTVKVPFPPLKEQKAIAEVLSSLDDKIDLLHRQNKTLEALAQTLFRQWFIEEAEDEWEEYEVRDFATHKKVSIKPAQNPNDEFLHFSLPAFDTNEEPNIELGSDIKSNKYQVEPFSILMSKLNPKTPRVWDIYFEPKENSICSTEFQVIQPNKKGLFPFVSTLLKSDKVTGELAMSASGTSGSHQRVKPDDIFNISFVTPSIERMKEFSELLEANYLKQIKNQNQIKTLENMRDTLLPKLMSGEVRVEI